MEKLREILLFYTTYLYLVDYMLILLVFFLFTCVLLLCVFLRHKPKIALFIIAFDIIICFLIYIYAYEFIDDKARSRKTTITDQKIIQSSNALIVDFSITNTSKNNFKECKITAKIFGDKMPNDSILEGYKKNFLPLRQKSQKIKDLKKNTTQFQRISFENFNYENNYTLRLNSECF
ncbi:DUF2393 domain-containing protein [Campylobacter sp. VicNov18]|uniref:DUF2393 family protein n=1 Tax=Campylobacter bilis TaxID=2691918 RepID=UPI0013278BEB|nr:DUF2393 family protein [Campylobacter bilis]MPV63228.1 DUF2393 domain-containing protein [Campylobacter hepaticus]MBM0636727.1 DUF2393 domain-containing protein [Campylobacter bilis]MCC8277299.1 DUF2393 domain-containing protein [Campylobacter bilis]MCC8299042.1 DUF2393 domain-containing protein [Campylobacter bilis]MCC8300208.1 DUF2393 domain-containing protein [Campylobacter bilis]